MLSHFYLLPIRFPKATLLILLALTIMAFSSLGNLRWETDARVYFPKGHSAIEFDERVADVFGVKDSIIIGITNESGVFNPETLKLVERLTKKIADLPGVLTQRRLDVASLSSATVFVGTESELSNDRLMEVVPEDEAGLAALKAKVFENADLFVGNLVSADGKATMIRAKLKEGKEHRYQAYFQVKGILSGELGGGGSSAWGAGKWNKGEQSSGSDKGDVTGVSGKDSTNDAENPSASKWGNDKDWQGGDGGWGGGEPWPKVISEQKTKNGDRFYIAGRPVIEVTSGLNALEDMQLMIPMLIVAIAAALFLMFRALRGVVLPLLVVALAIVWTMGLMAALDVPLYTISTMLPVILVAVGIGDGIHLMSHYEDLVFEDPHRDPRAIVAQLMHELGMPLMITTLTTAVGFMALWWADMPPFRIFGIFTAVGIAFCWLASVTMVPAMLALMAPHVSGYLKRRRSQRVHNEASALTRLLVSLAQSMTKARMLTSVIVIAIVVGVGYGSRFLYVDSSWIADFRDDSEVAMSNELLNEKFDGTIFLSVVVDGKVPGALKSPVILEKIDQLQQSIEAMENVGGSLSLVDYIKSTNKTFHAGNEAYNRLPATQQEISEYLFLLSVSGRPEQLDTVVDFDYSEANITFSIKTDHTQDLKQIIDKVNDFVGREFAGLDVDVNLAGSANNSSVWAELLIRSQTLAIVLSKLGILLMAVLLFQSFTAGVYTVLPVTVTTVLIAGMAGWLSIPLDVSTVLAAGIAIGVGVDYAVHYIFRYAYERRQGMAEKDASLGAVRSVGKAIVLNAFVVTIGFMVLGLSQFPPHVKLGYFVSAYMIVACLVAIFLLPLVFSWVRPSFNVKAKA